MSNKIKIKNKKQKNTSEEYNKQSVLFYKSIGDMNNYILDTTLQLNLYIGPDIDEIYEEYKHVIKDYLAFKSCIQKTNLSEGEKEDYINGAVEKFNQCVSIGVSLSDLKGRDIIEVDDTSNMKKIENKTQIYKSDEYSQQYILWGHSLYELDYYMMNAALKLKFLNAPDIVYIMKLYEDMRENYISFIFVVSHSDLSEEKKGYYIKEVINKYKQCVCILKTLHALKGTKLKILKDNDNTRTDALLAAISKNKIWGSD
jgi:hypothetical protein